MPENRPLAQRVRAFRYGRRCDDREVDVDWATVSLAGGIATAIATTVSVALSLLWRLVDRERAEWTHFDGQARWLASADRLASAETRRTAPSAPSATVSVANIGRGNALAVRVVGLGCVARVMGEQSRSPGGLQWRPDRTLVPLVGTGETLDLRVTCQAAEWDGAQVALTWTASPRLFRVRRVERFPLRAAAPRPEFVVSEFNEENGQTEMVPAPEPPAPDLRPDLPALPGRLRVWARWQARRSLLVRP